MPFFFRYQFVTKIRFFILFIQIRDRRGDTPGNLFVKVRKQIDQNNWDEATTWFDGLGRTYKTQATDSQGTIFVETLYDDFGRVKATSQPYRQGDTRLWSVPRYDELNRAVESFVAVTDAETNNPPASKSTGITSFAISNVTNVVGTVVTTTDASGRKGRSISNALGQLLRVDEPTATGGTMDADLGTLANPAQPTFYTYDVKGNMVKVQQGSQNRYFLYDSLGRLIRVRQPEQEVNTPALDKTDPITGNNQWTAAYAYDGIGNLISTTDAEGNVITNTYDKAGRVKTRTYSDGTPGVQYFYDGKGLAQEQTPNYAKGKLTKVTSSISETRYKLFDNFGRLTEMEQRTPVGTETIVNATPRVSKYFYDFGGRLVKEEYPSGRVVENEFEADGDLQRIFGKANQNAAEQTYATGFSYTPDGRIQRLQLGNGLWESAKFNTRLQATEIALGHSDGDGSLWKLGYEYGEIDSNGNVDTTKNTGNIARQTVSFNGLQNPFIQTYKYDSLYRLTEARETSNSNQTWKQQFTYDRYGNRLTHDKFIGTTQLTLDNKTHPEIDELTNRFEENQGYSYDKNGNLTQDAEGRGFTFNGENKQIIVMQGATKVGEYFYDGEGKRVKKKVYDSTGTTVQEETVFVYSAGRLIAEYSTKPPPPNPTTNYTITDQLGSPRVIVNSLGEVISRRDFMPFGEELYDVAGERSSSLKYGTSEDPVRQKFTGYQKDDETGLDFAEARMYENRHARFTAVDPLLASGKSANPQTFNRYIYVMNNPLKYTDPSGLQAGKRVYVGGEPGNRQFRIATKQPKGFKEFIGNERVNATDGYTYEVTSRSIVSVGKWNQSARSYPLMAPSVASTPSNYDQLVRQALSDGFERGKRQVARNAAAAVPAALAIAACAVGCPALAAAALATPGAVSAAAGTSAGGAVIGGGGAFLSGVTVTNLLTGTDTTDVWTLPDTERGRIIEETLAGTEYRDWCNCGQRDNGYFPLVDFQLENTLVSLKSVNTTGSTWLERMQNHIRDLGTRGATVDNIPANMVLDLRVQPGGIEPALPLIEYGREFGVTVIVREF